MRIALSALQPIWVVKRKKVLAVRAGCEYTG
jgi:hypothetical protein